MLRAPVNAVQGLAPYSARDEFNQTAGALTGKVLPVGGTWTFLAGDTDDFQVDGAGLCTRTSVSDTGAGRYVSAGTTSYAAICLQTDLKFDALPLGGLHAQRIILRWVDANNYAYAQHMIAGGTLVFAKVVAGVPTLLGSIPYNQQPALAQPADTYWTLRVLIDAAGRYFMWWRQTGPTLGSPIFEGLDSALATGGALATGRIGYWDSQISPGAVTRTYRHFAAFPPTADAVLYPNQSAQLTTDGMVREDATGVAYGPIVPTGDLPRLPAAGREGRTVEVFLKGSRGDLDLLPDPGIDDISARAYYRPSWLFTPPGA